MTEPRGGEPSSQDIQGLLNAANEAKIAFDQFVGSSTATISQLVDRAKSDAAEVEQLKNQITGLKGGIETTQQAASSELGIITQAKADVETLKAAAKALSEGISNTAQDTKDKIAELQKLQAEMADLLAALTTIKAGVESKRDEASAAVDEIEKTKTQFNEMAEGVAMQEGELKKNQAALSPQIAAISESHETITALRKLLLEDTGDVKSVEHQISELKDRIAAVLANVEGDREASVSAISNFRAEAEKRRDELFASLQEKILALLPSAGAAGLAYTYYDAKSKYAPTSYAGTPGGVPLTGIWKFLRSLVGYNPASLVATCIFYTMFFLPLGILAYGSFTLLQRAESDPHFVLTYQLLTLRVLVAIPLAAISAFGFASLVLYRKYYEEYNHKQRVMELYESFKKEIDENGNEEQKKLLLGIMLNSVAAKASDFVKDDTKNDDSALAKLDRWATAMIKIKGAV